MQLNRGVHAIVSENLPWPAYAALIRRVDLGLTLMSTPHPSYPPLDLAACGAVAITNRYGMKQDLNSYSSNVVYWTSRMTRSSREIAAAVRLAQDRATRQRKLSDATTPGAGIRRAAAVLDELSDWA